ncbi:MAG: phosphatidylglycerophosphatase A [Candidatus Aminicenantes bacterium]|nr:phosphatidylglycerophosphatase A [Candidatus Aminicenantes bacterium]
MNRLLILIATFFNVGKFPLAPGTLASLITTVVFYVVNVHLQPSVYAQIATIALLFIIGIPAASAAEKHFKKKDPGLCVIDEIPGQMLSLLFVPYSPGLYAAGFFLFRFFDIIKPFPVRQADGIPGGFGVMFDDIVAGLYALGVLHLILYIF